MTASLILPGERPQCETAPEDHCWLDATYGSVGLPFLTSNSIPLATASTFGWPPFDLPRPSLRELLEA
ncbi:hypothetical protein AMTR_s00042p00039800 [Amborella trichopoda]|uniref:Uncharacterized protein n=1 Tax=Amborella trichopoda TaxID=13333 RepID=W1P7J3_AMBTC|nr:hypothetical protein AMTR_s00042p00039800 [Amborella trichopoda]